MLIGKGYPDHYLMEDEILTIVSEALSTLAVDGKRVLILIPDGTRTMPMPLMFSLFGQLFASRVATLDYLVALGTHRPMSDTQLSKLVDRKVVNGQVGKSRIYNHRWEDPNNYTYIGDIPAGKIETITN